MMVLLQFRILKNAISTQKSNLATQNMWLFLVEIVTTECTETPLAAQKAAKEKTSSKCPAAISSPVGMDTRHGGERRL